MHVCDIVDAYVRHDMMLMHMCDTTC